MSRIDYFGKESKKKDLRRLTSNSCALAGGVFVSLDFCKRASGVFSHNLSVCSREKCPKRVCWTCILNPLPINGDGWREKNFSDDPETGLCHKHRRGFNVSRLGSKPKLVRSIFELLKLERPESKPMRFLVPDYIIEQPYKVRVEPQTPKITRGVIMTRRSGKPSFGGQGLGAVDAAGKKEEPKKIWSLVESGDAAAENLLGRYKAAGLEVFFLGIEEIEIPSKEFPPLFDEEVEEEDKNIERLADSIALAGQIPFLVKWPKDNSGGKYRVIGNGGDYLDACKRLGLKSVLVTAEYGKKMKLIAVVLSDFIRKKNAPLKEAIVLNALISCFEIKNQEAANLFNKSVAWITSRLSILELVRYAELWSMVEKGELHLAAALYFTPFKFSEKQMVEIAREIIKEKIGVSPARTFITAEAQTRNVERVGRRGRRSPKESKELLEGLLDRTGEALRAFLKNPNLIKVALKNEEGGAVKVSSKVEEIRELLKEVQEHI